MAKGSEGNHIMNGRYDGLTFCITPEFLLRQLIRYLESLDPYFQRGSKSTAKINSKESVWVLKQSLS